MKFLCIPCDTPMRLTATRENEPGSLSVVYGCPECGYEMAMLTNVQETQMVRSLGVRIGPAATAPAAGVASAATGEAATGRCPFGAMLGADAATGPSAAAPAATGEPAWTPEALARLEAIPEMVRPMARAGIEMVAREAGHDVIDETVLETARVRFGM